MSLIEVLFALAISMVISYVIISLISTQNRAAQLLQEKLAVNDVGTLLRGFLQSPMSCGCLLQGKTFDTSTATVSVSSATLSIPMGYLPPPAPPCTPAPGFIGQVGASLNGTNIVVQNISLNDISLVAAGNYSANLTISLSPDSTVIPLRPIKTSFNFNVDTSDPATAQDFVSCGPPPLSSFTVFDSLAMAACQPTCGGSTPTTFPPDTWITMSLPASVPSTATAVLLRIVTLEAHVYVRPTGSGLGIGPNTQVIWAGDDYAGSIDTWINIGASPSYDIYFDQTDPPSYLFNVGVAGYR